MSSTPARSLLCPLAIGAFALLVGCDNHPVQPPAAEPQSPVVAGRAAGPVAGAPAANPEPTKPPQPVAGSIGTPTQPPPATPVAPLAYELKQLSSCDEVDELLRDAAIADMNKRVDQTSETYFKSMGCVQLAASGAASTYPAPPPGAPTAAPTSAPSATSTTNNQVVGVDEADFVKNDSQYIYSVGHGALSIVAAWPAAETKEVGRAAISDTPTKLFVAGDRALVYVSVPRANNAANGGAQGPSGNALPVATTTAACTYGYGCTFTGDGTDTAILVFDIADRTAPKLLRRLDVNGALIAARRIGNTVHTVVATPGTNVPTPAWPDGLSQCQPPKTDAEKASAKDKFAALRTKNEQIIRDAKLADTRPLIRENNAVISDATCGNIYRAAAGGTSYTSLMSFDMSQSAAPKQATIVSGPGAIYASATTLYMAVPQTAVASQPWFEGVGDAKEASNLHAFRIGEDPNATAYIASGVVQGRVLNQFSMDEKDNHLRIATTTGHLPDPDARNTLSVLGYGENGLQLSGEIDNIAKGEDIRSVRFDGDHGFMVTFKKTDPLFAFDLKDPDQPKMLGELMIPGFSVYIHLMDATHLLTIGYDAVDHGDFAFFDGVILQIFDVSHPEAPTLAQKTKIGTRGSSSEALADHLAFNFFQNKLAIPMTICEGGGDGMYGTDMTFSGMIVYDVSVDSGFKERGRVANPPANATDYDDSLCSNWWSNASTEFKRSIFMDDFVYAISPDVLRVQDTRAMGKDLAAVRFQQ